MTTMTDEELEVEYILWEADDPFDRPCQRASLDCPQVAIRRVWWGPDLEQEDQCHCCNSTDLCLACAEHLSRTDGIVYCLFCYQRTGGKFFKRAVRIEAINGQR